MPNFMTARAKPGLLAGVAAFAMMAPFGTGAAFAQDVDPADEQAEDTGSPRIAPIVVTAQKRTEDMQDVPIAIIAVNSETLQESGVTSTQDLQMLTPGLSTSQVAGGLAPRIRAIGSNDTSFGNEPSVAMYIDDVYLPSSVGGLVRLNNIERVEVLQGPQGTLFGRNATGGLIHVITKKPSHDAGGNFEFTYGNYDTTILNGYLTTGVAPDIATDVAVRWEKRADGWGVNPVRNEETYTYQDVAVRNTWLFTPGPDTTIRLSGDYWKYTQDNAAFHFVFNDLGQYSYQQDFDDLLSGSTWGLSLNAEHDFGGVTFRSITAYRDIKGLTISDADYSPAPILHGEFNSYVKAWTQEVQFLSPSTSKLQWIVGGFFMSRKAGFDPSIQRGLALSAGGISRQDSYTSQDTTSYAAFAQATYPIFENTNLTVGGRYTHDKQEYEGEAYGYLLGSGARIPIPPTFTSDQRTYNQLTYRVSLDHQFTPDLMAYVSVNKGFKAGTFPILTTNATPADPEQLLAYEAGIKAELLDRRVRLNLAGYIYDFQDFQQIVILGATANIVNADQATIHGIQLDGLAALTDNWNFRFGFNWMPKARFNDFVGCPGPQPGGPVIVYNCAGSRMNNAAKWDISLGTDYTIETENAGSFTFAAAYNYMSSFLWDADFGPVPAFGITGPYTEDGRSLLNLQAKWTAPGDRFYLIGFAKNVTDTEYAVAGTNSNGRGQRYMAGAPRTYGVTLGVDF